MTTKTLTGNYASAYVNSKYDTLVIDASASLQAGIQNTATSQTTVENYGTVLNGKAFQAALYMRAGGIVVNGSSTNTTALISGSNGIDCRSFYGPSQISTVTNFGTIVGTAVYGVSLAWGGTVTNGSATDTSAAITGGQYGVKATTGTASVANFGTINAAGSGYYGVDLAAGGSVTNGSAADSGALIEAKKRAIRVETASATITNYGSIVSSGNNYTAVGMFAGGTLVNGSATDLTAFIGAGNRGVSDGYGSVVNFGTIQATYGFAYGVFLGGAGGVTNGSASDSTATIYGLRDGVYLSGGAAITVTNYGTIKGTHRSVQLSSSASRLIAEAGSDFIGTVAGAGGTLELAGGTGTLTALGGKGALSGSIAANFGGFGSYVLDAGANWTLAGTGTLRQSSPDRLPGATAALYGTLTNAGGVTDGGTFAVFGYLLNSGSINGAVGANGNSPGASGAVGSIAADMAAGGSIDNRGSITGGTGGTGAYFGAFGGAGGPAAQGSNRWQAPA